MDKKPPEYAHLHTLLHRVRWAQYCAAIVAEVLILVAFFASGMDISLGGVMANMSGAKWVWAIIFSLGVDTSFVVSWVRCRQIGWGWHLLWAVPVAIGMSYVVFLPAVIQMMQQALDIDFQQALSILGINLVILVYVRAGIAVALGAILALTNVESAHTDQGKRSAQPVLKRRVVVFDKVLNKIAPLPIPAQVEQPALKQPEQGSAQSEHPVEHPAQRLHIVEQEVEQSAQDPLKRVEQCLKDNPGCSDRKLGELSGMAPATAKKYRLAVEQERAI